MAVKKPKAEVKINKNEPRWPFFAPYLADQFKVEDPFSQCSFEREPFADNIINLVESYKTSNRGAVIGLDAGWGYGKSTFMDMLGAKMDSRAFTVVRFNAWETDFASDPLLAFMAEFSTELKSALTFKKVFKYFQSIFPTFWELALDVAETTPSLKAKAVAKMGKFATATGKTIVRAHKNAIKKPYDGYLEDKKIFRDFKKELVNLSVRNAEKVGGPIVILIDELDRCRPDYAIELLENIKHFFNVPGIVFLLAVNKAQLEQSFKHVYYGGVDSEIASHQEFYLEKFVDFFRKLPPPSLLSLSYKICEDAELAGALERDIRVGLPDPTKTLIFLGAYFPTYIKNNIPNAVSLSRELTPRELEKDLREILLIRRLHKSLNSSWGVILLGVLFFIDKYTDMTPFYGTSGEGFKSAFMGVKLTKNNLIHETASKLVSNVFQFLGDARGKGLEAEAALVIISVGISLIGSGNKEIETIRDLQSFLERLHDVYTHHVGMDVDVYVSTKNTYKRAIELMRLVVGIETEDKLAQMFKGAQTPNVQDVENSCVVKNVLEIIRAESKQQKGSELNVKPSA